MIQLNFGMPRDCNICPLVRHYDFGDTHGFYCLLATPREFRCEEADNDGFKFANCPISVVDDNMKVLEKIKKEIEAHAYPIIHGVNNHELGMTLYGILQVIDKYMTESENKG